MTLSPRALKASALYYNKRHRYNIALKGEQIDLVLGYLILLALVNLTIENIKVHKFTTFALKRGPSRVSSGWSSLYHLAGSAEGSMALFFHPSQWLHSLPRDALEALTGSASQKGR